MGRPLRCRVLNGLMFGLGCLKMCRLLWLASAEYGAVVSAVGWASAHRPACRCFTVVAACRCFGGLKPTLLCLRLLPHRCRLNHPNRVFLFVLSIYRHIFRFPHASAECGTVVSAVGWASAHRPACCFAVVSVCRYFGGLKPTLLCLRLLPHRCRLNHPNRVFLFVLSIYRHIFRFPHASAECGTVVSAVGWASAHRPACCFAVVSVCRYFGGLKPTLLCLRLLPHRCRLNHSNRVFLFVLSIYRHIFRFPHASAECGAVVSAVGRASAHRPACCCFAVVSVCRCFGGLKPTLPKGKQLFAVIFVLFSAQGDFVRQAFADGVGQGVEFV